MDPPSEGASFSSPELALAFAKQHAVDHGYSLAIYRSRGKGSNRVWSLRCNQGDEATPCSFEVVVRCSNQEQAGSLWHVKVICAEHQGHELRTNLDDGKHGLSDRERQYIEQTLQCKPAVVIDEINKRRREEGEDELNSPKLVWNHRSRLRKTKSVSLRLLEPVHDVVTHHRQDGNEGVLFTYRIALSWAHRLQYVFALRTSNCIVDKQNCVLVQMMGFFPTSTSCPLAFAVVQTDDDASLSWALSQTRSLLARPTLSPAIVLASNSNAMRDAIARVWPKTTAIWDEDQSAASAAQSLRHFGVSSLSHVEGVRLATGKEKSKWLLQIVGEAIRWQQKQIEREAEEVKRQTYEGVRAMADSMTARTLFGLVSHKAIRVVYDATQEARARLAEARSFTLARAMARECTVGLPRRPIDALPSLGPLDTSACTTWANLGLPCQHRLAIILDSNPKATLSLDDIPSFWHLADEEDQPRDEVEEEAARGPGAKRRRTSTCGSAKH